MTLPTSLKHDERKGPTSFYLSTPLYLATTMFSLAAHILLILSGDGYDFTEDNILLFPILALFFSLMTGPIRCFFWILSFGVRVQWLRTERERTGDGEVRLGAEYYETKTKKYEWVGRVLLSWNAWVAATLGASLGVLIWRFVANAKDRVLWVQAGYGAAFLGIACGLHVLLAIPGFGDKKFAVLCYPFKEEYQMDDAEGDGA